MLNRKKGVAKVPPFKLHFTAKKNRGTVQLLMNQLRFQRTFLQGDFLTGPPLDLLSVGR